VSGVILFSEYNEAFGLHGPEMWATNEKTHASFQIAPHTYMCRYAPHPYWALYGSFYDFI
jgi:hypothetical protein